MGAITSIFQNSGASLKLTPETAVFTKWTIKDVSSLYKIFKSQIHGFSLVKAQLECILSVKEGFIHEINLDKLFSVLDTDHDGRIDGLELLGGLGLCSRGSFEDKAKFCFELYDFNENSSLSKIEMVMMMQASISGLLCLSGAEENLEPDIAEIESLSHEAFRFADKDKSGVISFEEFSIWARSNRELMGYLNYVTRIAEEQAAVHKPICDDDDHGDDDDDSALADDDMIVDMTPSSSQVKTQLTSLSPQQYDPPTWYDNTSYAFRSRTRLNQTDSNLTLQWIHGYNHIETHSNVFFLPDQPSSEPSSSSSKRGRSNKLEAPSRIIYPAASIAVIYDRSTHKQSMYMGHCSLISCLCLHPTGNICASSSSSSGCGIHVWDVNSLNCLSCLSTSSSTGFHQVKFSRNGRILLSVSCDRYQSIHLFDWMNNTLLSSGKSIEGRAEDVSLSPDCKNIIVVGDRRIKHLTVNGNSLIKRNVKIGHLGRIQKYTRVEFINDDVFVVGTINGQLYIFESLQLKLVIQAHAIGERISSLFYDLTNDCLLTGSSDGVIKSWNCRDWKDIGSEVDLSQDVTETKSSYIHDDYFSYTPISIQFCQGHLLVGSDGGDICLIALPASHDDAIIKARLVSSHLKGKISGLSMDPSKSQFATCGDDGTVRVWSIRRRQQLHAKKMPDEGACLCYSPSGSCITVGMNCGAVAVIDSTSLKSISSWKHTSERINVVKYSPNGGLLAIGSVDGNIYLYSVSLDEKQYNRHTICLGHHSYITHIDFSADSKFLQSNCGAYELLFWDSNGNQVRSALAMRDVNWSSWTCTLGWPVSGIWPACSDGTDINAVDCRMIAGVVACAMDNGQVRLMGSPCLSSLASEKCYYGHAGAVSNLCFSDNHHYLISSGMNDLCLFQWTHKIDETTNDDDDGVQPMTEMVVPSARGDSDEQDIVNSGGDEFMAVKPWLGAIVAPSNCLAKPDTSVTDVDLSLAHVMGYSAETTRNSVFISNGNDIVYPAAAIGVVQSIVTNKQKFMQGHHTDDILCLAMHPLGNIAASGESGKNPRIVVWDTESLVVLSTLIGCHKRGVCMLAFNPSGTLLASIGLDDDHSIVIHDWKQNRLIATTQSDKGPIHSLCFISDATPSLVSLASCGKNHFKFYKFQGKNVVSDKASFDKTKKAIMISLLKIRHVLISCSEKGDLYVWKTDNKKILYIIDGGVDLAIHSTAITCVCSSRSDDTIDHFLTGDASGVVGYWGINFSSLECPRIEALFSINLTALLSLSSLNIKSIAAKDDVIIVGMKNGMIAQVVMADDAIERRGQGQAFESKLLVHAHSKGEVWGLATHNRLNLFCTSGDDETVRLWEVGNLIPLKIVTVNGKARAIAFHPKEDVVIAVGLSSGTVSLIKLESGKDKLGWQEKHVHDYRDPKQWAQDIKFSCTGRIMAVGGHDRKIWLFNVNVTSSEYSLRGCCQGHNSYISHIDFGVKLNGEWLYDNVKCKAIKLKSAKDDYETRDIEDSEIVLQSNCGAYELLFWDSNGNQVRSASAMRDVNWSSWTCTLGWPVSGIWPACSDGTDINAVDRNHCWSELPVVATADDFGKVKIFRYPCNVKGSSDKAYAGHSSHVTNIRFCSDDGFVISVGGNDKCAFVWRTDCIDELSSIRASSKKVSFAVTETKEELEFASQLHDDDDSSNRESKQDIVNSGGDEFMAVKPWLGAIVAPSNWVEPADNSLQDTLRLSYALGYCNSGSRNNCVFGSSERFLYHHIAAVGVRQDIENGSQVFNVSHTDDILCLCSNQDGTLIATGEIGKIPKIIIWDSTTASTVQVISGFHKRGVIFLAFSRDGSKIISIGSDDDHAISVNRIDNGVLVSSGKAGRDKIQCLAVSGLDASDEIMVTAGDKNIRFWDLGQANGGEMPSKKASLTSNKLNCQVILSSAFVESDAITGMSDGSVVVWKNKTIASVRKCHSAAVLSMSAISTQASTQSLSSETRISVSSSTLSSTAPTSCLVSARLITGGRDGLIILWDHQIQSIWSIDMTTVSPLSVKPQIRSVCMKFGCILAGTAGSEIYNIDLVKQTSTRLMEGHFDGETWGLCAHPTKSWFLTCGDEGQVRVWDSTSCRPLYFISIDTKCRCISTTHDGSIVAVGGDCGRLVIMNETLERQISDQRIGKKNISCVKYSPNGNLLAVGSHDGNIYLLNTNNYSQAATCVGHHSYITHIDFSADSKFLQSNCGAYELLFWDSNGNQVRSASAMRDVNWSSWTCTLGWPVSGIWPACSDGTDINAVDRNAIKSLVATADDFGQVKIFRYPANKNKSVFATSEGNCHSSHVTNVCFVGDGSVLVSTGGNDKSVLIWKLIKQTR